MGDLMDVLTRYAESDGTKDPDSDEDKVGKNQKGEGGKGNQQSGNEGNQNNKRKQPEGGSEFVANTNTGFRHQRRSGGPYNGNKPRNYVEALKAPCPKHSTHNKPSNHSWENCNIMQEFRNQAFQGHQGANGGHSGQYGQLGSQGKSSRGFAGSGFNEPVDSRSDYQRQGNAGNRQHLDQGNQQNNNQSGFQSNPKQLNNGEYHISPPTVAKRT